MLKSTSWKWTEISTSERDFDITAWTSMLYKIIKILTNKDSFK